MDIEELKQLKHEIELMISDYITGTMDCFHKKTCLQISGIDINVNILEHKEMGKVEPDYFLTNTSVTIHI